MRRAAEGRKQREKEMKQNHYNRIKEQVIGLKRRELGFAECAVLAPYPIPSLVPDLEFLVAWRAETCPRSHSQ